LVYSKVLRPFLVREQGLIDAELEKLKVFDCNVEQGLITWIRYIQTKLRFLIYIFHLPLDSFFMYAIAVDNCTESSREYNVAML
jgi:hypothetical protein